MSFIPRFKHVQVQPLVDLVPDARYPLELVEAELGVASSWPPAVEGCSYVFHVASPFPSARQIPQDENVIIRPAVDGVINVLTACSNSGGTVKRVVVTSSVAAISSGMLGNPDVPDEHVYTEDDWSVEAACPPYEKSKLLAERAAWDFVKKLDSEKLFEFVVVNPGYIQGPLLSAASGAGSVQIAVNLLEHKVPGVANSVFSVIDVRDVAAAEIAAMFTPTAAGKRYILSAQSLTMKEMALILKGEFGPQGYNIPTTTIPKFVLWGFKFFDKEVKSIYPGLNRKLRWSNERMVSELAVNPRPVEQTMIEMAYNIIELGIVKKTPGYLGPPSTRDTGVVIEGSDGGVTSEGGDGGVTSEGGDGGVTSEGGEGGDGGVTSEGGESTSGVIGEAGEGGVIGEGGEGGVTSEGGEGGVIGEGGEGGDGGVTSEGGDGGVTSEGGDGGVTSEGGDGGVTSTTEETV